MENSGHAMDITGDDIRGDAIMIEFRCHEA